MKTDAPKVAMMVIVRTVVLILTAVNQLLTLLGIPAIPIDNVDAQNWLSTLLLLAAAVWSWWFDNDITIKARIRKLLVKKALAVDQNKSE